MFCRSFAALAVLSSALMFTAVVVSSCGEQPSFQNQTVQDPANQQVKGDGSGDSQVAIDVSDHKGSIRVDVDDNISYPVPVIVEPSPNSNVVAVASPTVAPSASPTPAVVINSPQPIVIPPACDEHGATQAVLLTTTMTNGGMGGTLQYRIFKTDCEGNILKLTADKIWFDIDAVVSSFVDINYTLASDAKTDSGIMNDIIGSDLFGNKGSNWGHWETSKAVTVTSNTRYVTLSITLPSQKFTPRKSPSNMLPTYLKFGDAAAVEKVVPLK